MRTWGVQSKRTWGAGGCVWGSTVCVFEWTLGGCMGSTEHVDMGGLGGVWGSTGVEYEDVRGWVWGIQSMRSLGTTEQEEGGCMGCTE